MRLWSIHPKYLDSKGLLALWREGLLAKKIIEGEVKAFKNHPQLKRFINHANPREAIKNYLMEVWKEAERRGYDFHKRKIGKVVPTNRMPVTKTQLKYEFNLLCAKLKRRDSLKYRKLSYIQEIECHPSFKLIEGGIEEWERAKLKIRE